MKAPLETSLAYKYFVAYRLYDGQRFDEVVIPYKPKNSFQKRIRRGLNFDKPLQIGLALMCVAISAACWPNPPLPFLFLIACAAAVWAGLQLKTSMQPTHFGLSKKGLRLYWIRWFGDKSSGYIPWANIAHVRMRKSKEALILDETWIDFVGNDGNKNLFTLRLDGLVTGEQRKRLHTALGEHLRPEQIDWALHDTLNPVKVDGYTQLWLEVLATSPQRSRQDTLPVKATLANGRYEITGTIGTGGQGIAYLGRLNLEHYEGLHFEQNVVLKEFVLPYHAGLSVCKKALEHIQKEAELLRSLEHPRIVKFVDLFVEDQRAYFVLQHIEGKSLRHIVDEQGAFSEEQVANLADQMCEILLHLHAQNPPILHRDFTPENLILNSYGDLYLIDFNVAQQMQSTATRTVVGKHSYVPPEQFRGKATIQSDLYAMGATMFFLLTGKEPEPITVAHPRQLRPEVSPEMDTIVAQATAPDCDIRYKSAHDIMAELQTLKARVSK
jgi:predicted Ser/Thr protein kinase